MKKYLVIDKKDGGACYVLSEVNEIKCGLAKDLLRGENCNQFKSLETIMIIYFSNGKYEAFSLNNGKFDMYFE